MKEEIHDIAEVAQDLRRRPRDPVCPAPHGKSNICRGSDEVIAIGMSTPEKAYVYVDGKFYPEDEAKISVFDHGFMYGDGVFDTMVQYRGGLFKLDEHIDRLYMSAAAIKLNIPLSKQEMKKAVIETVKKNHTQDTYIKIYISRGKGLPWLDPSLCKAPTIVIMVIVGETKKYFDMEAPKEGLKVFVPTIRKTPSICLDSRIKSLQYLNNILARIEAKAAGADDAILLDINGFVAEGSGENVFLVKDGVLYTPPTTNTLDGITRRVLIDIAHRANIEVVVGNLTMYDLYMADEVFFASTAGGAVPIGQVNGRRIGTEWPGPITAKLRELYFKELAAKSTPVY